MATNRIYINCSVFGGRIVSMRNLWEPSTEYQGKKQDKPSYLFSFITPKTRAVWFEEPLLADLRRGCEELYQKAMSNIPFPQVVWPVKDGDIPEPGKTVADWMRNHWYISASSTDPISTEMVGPTGLPVKLTNRAVVKPGDLCGFALTLAVKTNDARAVKLYGNNVLFMNPGEEIAVGNTITGAEMMEKARQQGMNITGFTPAGGGFQQPQQQQGGFGGGGGFQSSPQQQPQQGGFGPGNAAGTAQTQANPAQTGFAGGQSNGGTSGFASPSNQQGGQGGFVNPGQGGFTAPQPAQPQQGFGGGFPQQ